MEAYFEPEDKYSWFFGPLSRDETNDILQCQCDGVFLVRSSQSIQGDFVLCVKEDNKVSHYIINRIQSNGVTNFKIGDRDFSDIPSLLSFYKSHYLDTATLIKPAPREKLMGKFDFAGKDPEDLPFQKGDILELISKDEEEWWTARDQHGRVGQIPVTYTTKVQESNGRASASVANEKPAHNKTENTAPQPVKEVKLPAYARVIVDRTPNAYDKTQLRLRIGEVVKVLNMNINGQWEGEVNGRRGIFPFTHVQFVTETEVSST